MEKLKNQLVIKLFSFTDYHSILKRETSGKEVWVALGKKGERKRLPLEVK